MNKIFDEKWIGRGGPITWPTRSLDLKSPDYFLWGFVKEQHKVILVTQSMKIVEKSNHIGIITFKGSFNLGLGLPTEDARSDDPRLVSTC